LIKQEVAPESTIIDLEVPEKVTGRTRGALFPRFKE
jgi:hypothetical protein